MTKIELQAMEAIIRIADLLEAINANLAKLAKQNENDHNPN